MTDTGYGMGWVLRNLRIAEINWGCVCVFVSDWCGGYILIIEYLFQGYCVKLAER